MKDLTGQRFGRLTAIRPTEKRIGSNIVWELRCDCGNVTHVHTGNLGDKPRNTKSCGCIHKDVVNTDIEGERFSRLIAIRPADKIGRRTAWRCLCDCGNEVDVTTSHLKAGGVKSCGCIRSEIAGVNHPNYNPNKTDEERLKKRYVLGEHPMHKFRNGVYERDHHTCRVCGQVGKELNAHHLDGWNWATDRRFDVSNGVTLCEECHIKFHKTYGKGNNTKEQFEEFNKW